MNKINFKGYFKLECIDANNNCIDTFEDKNMIMDSARVSMSEIFANLNSSQWINKVSFGTMGHTTGNVLVAKNATDGFKSARDRMFCESGNTPATALAMTSTINVLNKNDVFYFGGSTPGYYRYLKVDTTVYAVSQASINNQAEWEFLGTTAPYLYEVNFNLPKTNSNATTGDAANITSEIDGGTTFIGTGSSINVAQSGTSVTFHITLLPGAGNHQMNTYSTFTEAALYANGRIFSMKTFPSKVKDSTVSLKITWTITF